MTVPPTKAQLEVQLARYRDLEREFPDGSIAAMIRDLEDELRDQLRLLERP
jgi:hypothetical protein